jgi:hypothetical protein
MSVAERCACSYLSAFAVGMRAALLSSMTNETIQSRTVTVCVGTDPTFIGSDATNTELLQWAERVCFAAGEKFDCDVVLLQRNDVGAVDCDDPEVRSWLRQISQGDEWMQYL